MTTAIDLGRPEYGDVLDLIAEDHRRFEYLLAQLRLGTSDRDAVRQAFADVLIAHAEAGEQLVYPVLRAETGEQAAGSPAAGTAALLAVLELDGTDTAAFLGAVEDLSTVVARHIAEQELGILEPARTEVSERTRYGLGEQWARRRNELIDGGCGAIDNVRRIVLEDTEG